MTRYDCLQVLNKIKKHYPEFCLNEEIAEAWFDILGGYEYEAIDHYLTQYIEQSVYTPKIANLTQPYQTEYEAIVVAVKESLQVIKDYTEDDTHTIKTTLVKWLKDIYFLERKKAVRQKADEFRDYANGEKKSFIRWVENGH